MGSGEGKCSKIVPGASGVQKRAKRADLFTQLGVQGGEHPEVYGTICPALSSFTHRYGPVSPIGGPGRRASQNLRGHLSQTLGAVSSFQYRYEPVATKSRRLGIETTQRRLQGGVGKGWERFLASFWNPAETQNLPKLEKVSPGVSLFPHH